jgi:hypothetical protein
MGVNITQSARERMQERGRVLDAERLLIGGGLYGDRESLAKLVCGVLWLDGESGWHGRIGAVLVEHLNGGGQFMKTLSPEVGDAITARMREAGVVTVWSHAEYLRDCLEMFTTGENGATR